MEDALEKLSPGRSASSELEGVIEQPEYLQEISRQIINEFGDVSKSINDIQLTIRKVTLALDELK